MHVFSHTIPKVTQFTINLPTDELPFKLELWKGRNDADFSLPHLRRLDLYLGDDNEHFDVPSFFLTQASLLEDLLVGGYHGSNMLEWSISVSPPG